MIQNSLSSGEMPRKAGDTHKLAMAIEENIFKVNYIAFFADLEQFITYGEVVIVLNWSRMVQGSISPGRKCFWQSQESC